MQNTSNQTVKNDTSTHQDTQSVKYAKLLIDKPEELTEKHKLELKQLIKQLKAEFEFGYAHRVIFVHRTKQVQDTELGEWLCQQHALCLSKDIDLSTAKRQDGALEILGQCFKLGLGVGEECTTNQETLGIAGGICKRRWEAFGQKEDLRRSFQYYRKGYQLGMAKDFGYTAINAAFVNDLLNYIGDNEYHRGIDKIELDSLRAEIVSIVEPLHTDKMGWWYYATLAEAYFGQDKFAEAKQWIDKALQINDVPYWEYESTTRQLTYLARIRQDIHPENPAARKVIDALLQGSPEAIDSCFIGKVGLALSGGGFRASFFHLGLLAYLAERDVLRHIDTLSCVSGGSIIGAHYFLKLRSLLLTSGTIDYVKIIEDLINEFTSATEINVRDQSLGKSRFHLLNKLAGLKRMLLKNGALCCSDLAEILEQQFYAPAMGKQAPIWMHELNFQPADHDPLWRSQGSFNPLRHNWRRANKVPALILNATSMNTGHNWQFTTNSMGESPYTIMEDVDNVPRLRRSWYLPEGNPSRRIRLGQAVAASAGVPKIIEPLLIKGLYAIEGEPNQRDPVEVFLVDGGIYDNQGTMALLANDCNVLIVSDAAGQLNLKPVLNFSLFNPTNTYTTRSIDVLMERIRHANFAELRERLQSHRLQGLMFVHMKKGLDATPIPWINCDDKATQPTSTKPPKIRRDFQQTLAQLRTDLNVFNQDEYLCLMACGYQMASESFDQCFSDISSLVKTPPSPHEWIFSKVLDMICGRNPNTEDTQTCLKNLQNGCKISL